MNGANVEQKMICSFSLQKRRPQKQGLLITLVQTQSNSFLPSFLLKSIFSWMREIAMSYSNLLYRNFIL